MYIDDTIAAIATPTGIGGVGIIRVSGKQAVAAVGKIFKSNRSLPLGDRQNRTIQYGHIVTIDNQQIIDEVLLLLMKGPHSYTAEDVVEIQCHGGSVVVQRILKELLALDVRLAEPGEFTKRAFLNGRIDLSQAEAIIDLIDAKTEESATVAVNQLSGTVSKLVSNLRQELITTIARMEVTIDYPEEDIEDVTAEEAKESIKKLLVTMDEVLLSSQSGRLVRDGVMAAIVGLPNAGKSSLMNVLLQENRAIVTDIPGTTRDSIEEYMNIEGIPVRLVDTAGIRETDDIIEKMGVDRAKNYLAQADLVICVIDASKPILEAEIELLKEVSHKNTIVLLNKADINTVITKEEIQALGTYGVIEEISVNRGEGLNILRSEVLSLIYKGHIQVTGELTLSNVRHISLMEKAKKHLEQALLTLDEGLLIDCAVTDIRTAWELLGEITGDSVSESLVDELFKRFCLGK